MGLSVEYEWFNTNCLFLYAVVVNRGYKIFEVPIEYVARAKQEGKKICWRRALEMFWCILKYRFAK